MAAKMRMRLWLIALVGFGCIATVVGATEVPDELCAAIGQFTTSVRDNQTHHVTLRTDWSIPEPTRACQRSDEAPERTLCAWLVEHTSTEFMTVNIQRVLR